MTIERHEFGKPNKLAGELEARLLRWFKAAAELAPDFWSKALPVEATLACTGCSAARAADALAALPDTCVAYRIRVDRDILTVLALPRSLVLALVAGLQGDLTSDPVTDRELTAVDDSLWQYFLQQLFLPPFRETWPGPDLPTLELDQPEPLPQWSRVFAGAGPLVVCTFVVRGPFGEEKGSWLLPQKALVTLLGDTTADHDAPTGESPASSSNLETLVRELPVEIVVQLGTAEIALSQLASLQVGDMLILDQRASDPLTAQVEGKKKLVVWPGRVGDWKAIQIDR